MIAHHTCSSCGGRLLPRPAGAATRYVCPACDLDILPPLVVRDACQLGATRGVPGDAQVTPSMPALKHGSVTSCANTLCGMRK